MLPLFMLIEPLSNRYCCHCISSLERPPPPPLQASGVAPVDVFCIFSVVSLAMPGTRPCSRPPPPPVSWHRQLQPAMALGTQQQGPQHTTTDCVVPNKVNRPSQQDSYLSAQCILQCARFKKTIFSIHPPPPCWFPPLRNLVLEPQSRKCC